MPKANITYEVYGFDKKTGTETMVSKTEFNNVEFYYDGEDSVILTGLSEDGGYKNITDTLLEKIGYYPSFPPGFGEKHKDNENNLTMIKSTKDCQGFHKKMCSDEGFNYSEHVLTFTYN